MPERLPTTKPTVIAGTILNSGDANTGQVMYSLGGAKTHSVQSGTAGGHGNICIGAGRLDAGFMHDSAMIALSGIAITFYDAAAAVSGAASGLKIVGVLAPSREFAATGISGAALRGGEVRNFGFAFTSGLCHTGASGNPGWTVSYTPVLSGVQPN